MTGTLATANVNQSIDSTESCFTKFDDIDKVKLGICPRVAKRGTIV